MPNRSQASRSHHVATGHIVCTDGTGVFSSVVDDDPQPLVQRHRQQIVDDVEAFCALRPVDAADVHHLLEREARIVAQRGHQHRQRIAVRQRDHLALLDPHVPHARKRANGVRRGQPRRIVPVRRIFFCNCMMPYTSASAVGGQPGT